MKTRDRILIGVATLLLGAAAFTPIWRIEIWAPQYPEGLVMQIASDRIVGDIDQVNILNHYIGMKKIKSEEFPEFKIAPWLFVLIVVWGLVAVYMGRKILVSGLLAGLLLVGTTGFADFFRWNYDYGHNLNPEAPIKIPGLSYQPPLFGHKMLLNINSYSLPDLGAYLILIASLILFWVLFGDKLSEWRETKIPDRKDHLNTHLLAVLLACFFLSGCTSGPEAISAGADHCANCHMSISDTRFAAEAVTAKGRTLKFDSIPCLLAHLRANQLEVKKVFVSDYFKPTTLVDAEKARFLVDGGIKGPMGEGAISSVDSRELAKLASGKGRIIDWPALLAR